MIRSSTGARYSAAWAPLLYAAAALAFWGPWVLGSPGSTILAANDIDPSALMWFLSWWPHALLNGLNPFYTEVIFVPEGYNLAWVTSMPGLSLLLAPVTLSLGPEMSWNLISFAAPVLSAWTAFLLCRHITGEMAPSLVGGYIFGFSPYMLGHLSGAPHLAFVALLPVFVLLVLRHLGGTLSDRTFTVVMTAALTAEILISTEVLATAALFGGIAMAVAYLLWPELRRALRRTGLLLGVSLAGTVLLASPLLYYVFFRERTLPDHALEAFPADLLAFVVPGSLLAASPEQLGRTAPDWASSSPYIGLPLLVLVGVFAWRHWRSRPARLGVVMFLLAALAALGKALQVGGEDSGLPLPWAGFAELPLLRYALPIRFSLFVFLAAAVIVALWLASRPGAGRWLLALLVVGSLLPALGNSAWHTRLPDVAFFENGGYEEFLDEDDRVLTVPVWGKNMRWHFQAGFSFQLASGYVGAFPKSYVKYPAWTALLAGSWSSPSGPDFGQRLAQLRRFVADKGVTAIVVERNAPGPLRRLFAELAGRPVSSGGVLLYRLTPASVLGPNLSLPFRASA